jgi:pimeloyl-ACP methyl ester carboxylesterase
LKQAERNLLKYSGLPEDQIEIVKVPVFDDETYVSTIFAGEKSAGKPVLVLVHGFGGSAVLFYRVMKGLAEHFYLVMFDIIGMGASSRPEFTADNYIDTNSYMLRVIEEWRKYLQLTNFFLAGHSYGGYLCGLYASWKPEHIKKLLLLSPLGVKQRPENFDLSQVRFQQGRAPPKWFMPLAKALWGKITPFSVARKMSDKRVRNSLRSYIDRH